MRTLLMLKRGVDYRSKLRCKRALIWGATIEAHIISKMQPSCKFGTNDENE